MKEGILIYDPEKERMDIRFGMLDFYGGLDCGERLEVNIEGEWIPTRLEFESFWYLYGVRIANINGLIVRVHKSKIKQKSSSKYFSRKKGMEL